MPLGDRTGPRGMGPMTGRGAGYCAGFNTPGYMNPGMGGGFGWGRGGGWGGGFGRGYGRGWGRGMGWGRWAAPTAGFYPEAAPNITPDQQKQFLEEQLKMMEQEMNALKKQLASLEKEKK